MEKHQTRDGREYQVRYVEASDEEKLRYAIDHADPETLRRRYLGGRPPQGTLLRLVDLDHHRRSAVAAFTPEGEGVGIARYEGEKSWPQIEVAVAVDPRWRRQGVAATLLQELLQHAEQEGATGVIAEYYANNDGVRRLLQAAGYQGRSRIACGVAEVEFPLHREESVTR